MSPPPPVKPLPHPDARGHTFAPNFSAECYMCGSSPTVVVVDHVTPQTLLCGTHFFADRLMVDWALWNDPIEDTE